MADAHSFNGRDSVEVTVSFADANGFDPDSDTSILANDDGSIEVSWGKDARPKREPGKSEKFDDNLADYLTDAEMSQVAERLMLGIDQDLQSRSEWLENMSAGISLLGLQIKNPRGAAASGATPAEGVSTVDSPLLLEAVLRFQANALGELLPADGPVKVRNDGESNALTDKLAEALEKDMNHYLTKVAKEYYPDTDRMLLMLGFCGISFKKGFHDPVKRRPVIASINAEDLIVSNTATNIDGAGRVTHRIMMRPSLLRRMQLVGAYRDIVLPDTGMPPQEDAVKSKVRETQGIAPPAYVEPGDQDRELYECYTEIDLPGFEHTLKDDETKEEVPTGLPLPYKVVLDKESRQILEIRREWDEEDLFCLAKNRIIAYIFIPGLGFYGIGLLNVLGNAAKAVTAAWRLLIDAGMYANFPGFLYLKSLAKQLTNQFRVPPGGGLPIDTSGTDIRQAIMPLPYKDPSAVFIQFISTIAEAAQRVGGTAELQIGEGTQNAPVGTTLALIEQATRLMAAVHKRLHQALGQELDMLKNLLMEDPEALWRHNKKSKVLKLLTEMAGQKPVTDQMEALENQHRALFLTALSDAELVPASDPNTSSQTERYMKVVAARQMAQTNPSIDMNAVDEKAFQVMGWDNPEQYFKPAPPPGSAQPSPEELTAQATIMAAQARIADSRTRAQEAQVKATTGQAELASKEKIASLQVARELIIHNSQREHEAQASGIATSENAANRLHKLALANMAGRAARAQGVADNAHEANQAATDRAHEAGMADQQRRHQFFSNVLAQHHEATQGELDRQHERAMQPAEGVARRASGGRVESPVEPQPARVMTDLVEALRTISRENEARTSALRSMVQGGTPVGNDSSMDALTASVNRLIDLQSAPRVIIRDSIGRPIGARIDLPAAKGELPAIIKTSGGEIEIQVDTDE
jgi:hypothetical protein